MLIWSPNLRQTFLLECIHLQVLPVLVDVVEAEDVCVLDELHDGDLALDLLQHRLGQLVLVDDLDGNLLPQHAVRAQLDQAWKSRRRREFMKCLV